jgi:hypothetical protein
VTQTALWPLHVALADALKTLPMFVTLGPPRVFQEGSVLRSASLPYIIIGGSTEAEDSERYFGQPGRSQEIQLKSWGGDREEAFAIHAEATVKLDGQSLVLTGHKLVQMKFGHLADFKEQGAEADQPGPYVVIGRLRTETLQQ